MFSPGRADQPITLEKLTVTQDGMGGTTEAWATDAKAPKWAEYWPLRGLERIEAGKLEQVTDLKLRIRRYVPLDASYRVKHKGRTYRITGVEDGQRAGDMVLNCQEVR